MSKTLMSGNEAIARGAYEYGVKVAAAYPGTPSTEILENTAKYPEIYSQWSPNEKVALEVGIGASIAGARTLCAMKHVGVNVAADPLMTFTYTGVNGGFVLVTADDPGMHSSQNEQDNRFYAKFGKMALVEPSDSQECKDFLGEALKISETFDGPVLFRITTRVAHSQGLVELGEPMERQVKPYEKDIMKYVMMPGNARLRRHEAEKRMEFLKEYAEITPLNRIEWKDKKLGVITSGMVYQYVKEALPDASILKLGLTFPLPEKMIREFAAQVDEVVVVEELDPFIEEQIRFWGIPVKGREIIPGIGELSARILQDKLGVQPEAFPAPAEAPMRPPVMCPGCPHRGTFYVLKQLGLTVSGDIGCYTLGAVPPLGAIDTTICMGASIGAALGMEKAHPEMAEKLVAVIGDSTFLHSGIQPLIDVVYNKGRTTVLILDNDITAMTGHQDNPASGKTLMGEEAPRIDFAGLAKAVGIKRVFTIDPFDVDGLKALLKEETATPEPSVIVVKRPCILIVPQDIKSPVEINGCTGCRACMRIGCPALVLKGREVTVNQSLCTGCNLCVQLCKFGCIKAGK